MSPSLSCVLCSSSTVIIITKKAINPTSLRGGCSIHFMVVRRRHDNIMTMIQSMATLQHQKQQQQESQPPQAACGGSSRNKKSRELQRQLQQHIKKCFCANYQRTWRGRSDGSTSLDCPSGVHSIRVCLLLFLLLPRRKRLPVQTMIRNKKSNSSNYNNKRWTTIVSWYKNTNTPWMSCRNWCTPQHPLGPL